jgi:ubiquinone/menaquinone biosynthesis C-methylase UbiE
MKMDAASYFTHSNFAARYDAATAKMKWIAPAHVVSTILEMKIDPQTPLHVLDVGAGTGILSAAIKAAFPNTTLHAIDASPTLLNVAIEQGRVKAFNVTIENLRKNSLPYNDNSFDLVVSSGATEYLGPYKRIIQEMARVAKPHGHIVSTFRNCSAANLISSFAEAILRKIPVLTIAPPKNLSTPASLKKSTQGILIDIKCSAPYTAFQSQSGLPVTYITFSGQKAELAL